MCGLVGMVAKRKTGFFDAQRELFQNMLMADSIRGADSTGAFCVNKNNTINVLKFESHPMHLFATDAYDRFERKIVSDGLVAIGHNRKATQGKVSNDNSHPFHSGDVTLVHNGTLSNHKEIDATTEVDSHAIANSINELGHIAALKKIRGAYALIWYKESEKALYMVTNGERPLTFVETDDFLYIASELGMLYWLIGRTGAKIDSGRTRVLKEYELVKLKIDSGKITTTVTDISKEVKPVFIQPAQMHYPGWNADGTGTESVRHNMHSQVAILELMKKYPKDCEVVFLPSVTKPMGTSATQEIFMIEGVAYQPGVEVVAARYWLPKDFSFEDAADFGSEGKMIGRVNHHSSDKAGEWLILKDVHSDVWSKTWNNQSLTQREYEMICDVAQCKVCHKDLDKTKMETTSVVEKPNELYDCTCHKCVAAKKEDMSPEYKQRLEAALGNEQTGNPSV